MATKYFYAHHNGYGVGTTYQRPDGTIDSLPGAIYRFASRADRDAFVAADRWDGRYHREPVPAAAVRSIIGRLTRRDGRVYWDQDNEGQEYLVG